jgi:hypothetical protein
MAMAAIIRSAVPSFFWCGPFRVTKEWKRNNFHKEEGQAKAFDASVAI